MTTERWVLFAISVIASFFIGLNVSIQRLNTALDRTEKIEVRVERQYETNQVMQEDLRLVIDKNELLYDIMLEKMGRKNGHR